MIYLLIFLYIFSAALIYATIESYHNIDSLYWKYNEDLYLWISVLFPLSFIIYIIVYFIKSLFNISRYIVKKVKNIKPLN